MPDPMNTIDEAAEYLKVSVNTIRNLIERGDLRAVKVGGQWRIPGDALVEISTPKATPQTT